jgi:hypothetical protein
MGWYFVSHILGWKGSLHLWHNHQGGGSATAYVPSTCSVVCREEHLLYLFVEVWHEVLRGKQMVQLMQVTGVGLSELLIQSAWNWESLYCSSSIFKHRQALNMEKWWNTFRSVSGHSFRECWCASNRILWPGLLFVAFLPDQCQMWQLEQGSCIKQVQILEQIC